MTPKHVSIERVNTAIRLVRGQKVMLDADLAELYGVPVKALNQAVRRNPTRFPDDFMFQLSPTEASRLRSQIVTLATGRALERKSSKQFNLVFQAIRQLMTPPAVPPRRIGFHAKPDGRKGE
jgi:hypothetical protein